MRIVIAEDAALFRAGLVRLLEDEGHQVCAEVGDGEALLAAVLQRSDDVMRLRRNFPNQEGWLSVVVGVK